MGTSSGAYELNHECVMKRDYPNNADLGVDCQVLEETRV